MCECDLPNCFNKAFYSFRNIALRICFDCFVELQNSISEEEYDAVEKED